MSNKHYYIVVEPKCDSVLHSKTPSGAAAKAFRCLSGKSKDVVIKVQRRDGSGKVMSYRVRKIHDPKTVDRDGVKVTYKYRVKVSSLNKSRSKSRSVSKSVSKSRSRSSSKSRSRSSSKSRSRSSSPKRANPKSKKACANASMEWVKGHPSKSAKGKKIHVKGSCRKKHNKK